MTSTPARTRDVVCIRREETASTRFSGWLVDTAVPPSPGSHRGAALVNKAYSLFTTHPAFLAALNLPAGYVAFATNGRLTAVHDHTGALVVDGPFPSADLP